jgi:hypothetical protein
MSVEYTNADMVAECKSTDTPLYGRTVDGYGGKIPTRFMVKYGTRWHRVYAAQYGNAASLYVVHGGRDLVLDTDTEYRLQSVGG